MCMDTEQRPTESGRRDACTVCKVSACFGLDQRNLSFNTDIINSRRYYVFLI